MTITKTDSDPFKVFKYENKCKNNLNTTLSSKNYSSEQKDGFISTTKDAGKKVILGIGIAGAIGAGIYLCKTGKGKQIIDRIKKIFEGEGSKKINDINKAETEKMIKKFTNQSGEIVSGVRLSKGMAVLENNSGFSGVMNTVNANGNKISITYENGLIKESRINDKLFKRFDKITVKNKKGEIIENIPRKNGVRILEFNSKGQIIGLPEDSVANICEHTYYDNGKLKRSANLHRATDFFENGKIQAKEIRNAYVNGSSDIEWAELYNENGQVIKKIMNNNTGSYTAEVYPDEKTIIKLKRVEFKNKDKKSNDLHIPLKDKKYVTCGKIEKYSKSDNQYIGRIDFSDNMLSSNFDDGNTLYLNFRNNKVEKFDVVQESGRDYRYRSDLGRIEILGSADYIVPSKEEYDYTVRVLRNTVENAKKYNAFWIKQPEGKALIELLEELKAGLNN